MFTFHRFSVHIFLFKEFLTNVTDEYYKKQRQQMEHKQDKINMYNNKSKL